MSDVLKLKEMATYDWRGMLGTLLTARDKASHQGFAGFFIAETSKVPHNSDDRKKCMLTPFWDCIDQILEHDMLRCHQGNILRSTWNL